MNIGAIVAGILCGALSGAPYFVALTIMRKRREASILPGVIAACLSIVIVALSVLLGWALIRSALLEFAIALVITFLAVAVTSVVLLGFKPRP